MAATLTYERCGLSEFRFRFGANFNDTRWIFDLASGTLVGQLWDNDVCDRACGCTIRAGRFPAADCVATSVETICREPQLCTDGGNDGPHAEHRTLEGQTHDVGAKALAPVLNEFFGNTGLAEHSDLQ